MAQGAACDETSNKTSNKKIGGGIKWLMQRRKKSN
jgi:hypothetical protein